MGERESPERSAARNERELRAAKRQFFTLKNILIIIAGITISSLFALLTVGNYIAPALEQRRLAGQTQDMSGNASSDLANLTFFKVDPLIVNPAGSNGERYLKAVITLEMRNPKLQSELEKRLPQIKNQINNILSSKSIEQVQTNSDRERLRREIQNRVNSILVGGRISNVYFEEFVYQ